MDHCLRSTNPRQRQLVPPGGHVLGIYARTDIARGVHKAPANEEVRGIITRDLPARARSGRWSSRPRRATRTSSTRGASTSSATSAPTAAASGSGARGRWPTIPSGSTSTSGGCSSSSRSRSTRAPSGSSSSRTTSRPGRSVRRSISNFLTRVWRDGALMGTTPEEAFFVKCDRTTMTQDDIDNGRLICLHRHRAGEAGRVRDLPHQPEDARGRGLPEQGGGAHAAHRSQRTTRTRRSTSSSRSRGSAPAAFSEVQRARPPRPTPSSTARATRTSPSASSRAPEVSEHHASSAASRTDRGCGTGARR